MNNDLSELIARIKKGDKLHTYALAQAAANQVSTLIARRNYLTHRTSSQTTDGAYKFQQMPLAQRAWLGWYGLHMLAETVVAGLRDGTDRQLLLLRNRSIFESPIAPTIEWIMSQVGRTGGDEIAQYENVLQWVLRPERYVNKRVDEYGRPLEVKRIHEQPTLKDGLLRTKASWQPTKQPDWPLEARIEEKLWRLRVNEFPEDHLYTLWIDREEIGSFDNWPRAWQRPGSQASPL
jgi:hypothetical protein